MKILKLRLQNLNSLYGNWEIDFTDPELSGDTIFAITGPTGGGKTTILDAICLALYGATPRLDRITRSSNEIMSRGTGECMAEVIFATGNGVFCCHWSQHRARRKPDGRLAEARHEISDARSNELIESKKTEVLRAVEERTGIDFKRFQRSVMLAQGGFDSFLRARPDERAPILEQITGTGIYSEISVAVHERYRAEQEKLELLKGQVASLTLLNAEEREELEAELKESQARETALRGRRDELLAWIAWRKEVARLERETAQLQQGLKACRRRVLEAEPKRNRLDRAVRAAGLEAEWVLLEQVRQQHREILQKQQELQGRLPGEKQRCADLLETLRSCQESLAGARSQRQQGMKLIHRVRELDMELKAVRDQLRQLRNDKTAAAGTLSGEKRNLREVERRLERLRASRQQLEEYRQRHETDEALVGSIEGVKAQWKTLAEHGRRLRELDGELAARKRELAGFDKHIREQRQRLDSAAQETETVRRERNRTGQRLAETLGDAHLPDLRKLQQALQREVGLLRRVADLEQERSRLVAGDPCPLCGATEHPYSTGGTGDLDGREKELETLNRRIVAVERLEACRTSLDSRLARLVEKRMEEEKTLLQLRNQSEANAVLVKRLAGEKEREERKRRRLVAELEGILRNFGVSGISDTNSREILDTLTARATKWASLDRERNRLEQECGRLEAEREGCVRLVAQAQKNLDQFAEKEADLVREEARLLAGRRELFGDKQTDVEQDRLESQEEAVERAEKDARKSYEKSRETLALLHNDLQNLTAELADNKRQLDAREAGFRKTLQARDFADETQFLGARMREGERERLAAELAGLDRQVTETEAKLQQLVFQREEELKKQLTEVSLEELEPRLQEKETALGQVGQRLGALRERLDADNRQRIKLGEKMREIDRQRLETERWGRLHGLIGSSDGKKYRNFAQGLTFELMIGHANRQLSRMTDRYLLLQDSVQPLELNVVDNYQAGEIRSIKNLSGGESFLVSLALALGLSAMASRTVRVDSLFLDEGFGTLDEESLETALGCLARLQQQDKLVGVISHVGQLKERIPARIEVRRTSGGRSVISGPGCREG